MTVKKCEYGFVVICANYKPWQLKATLDSIRYNYNNNIFVIACENIKDCMISEYGIPSLFNNAIKNLPAKWNMIVNSGSWIRPNLDFRYNKYLKSNNDILFPITRKNRFFPYTSLHGVLLHKNTQNLKPMPIIANEIEAKYLWAAEAINQGFNFKGIAGISIN